MSPRPERVPTPSKPRNWRGSAKRPTPYNPLDLDNLGRSVEAALVSHAPEPLDSVELMTGAGIYAIYYKGGHPLYEPISASSNPIYVGQARSAGARKGSAAVDEFATPLWDRIAEHHESITQARDLNVADFEVRYLVAVEVFVSLAEQLMIKRERPVWNSVVDGFGNHDPGANRRKDSFRPPWDELHPGRWWAEPDKMPTASKISAAESARRIEAHFARDLAQLALEDEQLDLGSDLINE